MKTRIFLLLLSFSGATLSAAVFKDGDRWLAVGDSITQNGTYPAWVYLYYATRFPALTMTVENGGISGDSASGAVRRYPWDLQPRKATVATVMFGMNDVVRDLYEEEPPSPQTLARREGALEKYRKNLAELARQLQADGARIIFLTPTPFDETVESDSPRLTGVDGALAQCAAFMKKLASEIGATVIDLHEPMNALKQRLQSGDPRATLNRPDRVHPTEPAQFAMAYFFLKDQGTPGLVSEIELDAAACKVTRAENAAVSDLSASSQALTFQCLEQALPYPIPAEVRPALEWVAFQEELNREILRVSGLKGGSYTLFIDNQQIGDFKADELAAGLNLAKFEKTPQCRQALKVLDLVRKWQTLVANGDRGVAQVEHFYLKDIPHPVSFEAAKPKLEALLPTLDEKKDSYFIGIIKRYLSVKPRETQTHAKIREIEEAIRSAAQPVPHAYRLVPTAVAAVRPKPQRPSAERIAEIAGWLPPGPGGFCPPASDRAFWDKVDRTAVLQNGEKALLDPIPDLPEELYRDFEKTGRRQPFETPYFKRLVLLKDLALAESVEMKGRFLPRLREVVSAILSEPSWIMPASVQNYGSDRFKPEYFTETNVDLGVARRASDLAAVYQWLGDSLGTELKERIRSEIRRRAVDPYLARVYEDKKPAFFWIDFTNNWNAVCHAGVTYAALATVEDRETRARVVAGAAAHIVNFLNGITPDGYCSEGLGYWNYGFGHFVLLAENLLAATQGKLNLYADPGVAADVAFPLQMKLGSNLTPPFADCPPKARVEPWIFSVLARRFELPAEKPSQQYDLPALDLTLNPPVVQGSPQMLPEISPLRGYFPIGGVLVSRPTDPKTGLAVAMKGGHNDEHHNHNDLGSYALGLDNVLVMGDPGGEKYTRRTFGPRRYDSKLLSSYGHPVPVVNGQLQATGRQAEAKILSADFSEKTDIFALDLTKGYPVPGLTELKRSFTYHRDGKTSFDVLDEMKASAPLTFGTTLITYGTVEKKGDDTFLITEGRRQILVRFDTGGLPWSVKEEVLDEEAMEGRKPRRLAIELNEPAQTARIKYSVIPIPIIADNLGSPLASFPEIHPGTPGSVRIQAESFDKESGGAVEHVVRPGAEGQAIRFWDSRQHALEWNVSIPKAGRYYLAVRYASDANRDIGRLISLDGKSPAGAEEDFAFPPTGGWGNQAAEWQNVLLTRKKTPFLFALEPGAHSLRLTNSCGTGMNLDWIEFIPVQE
ncbi:MAG: GDSL-type esterase/lipase family protein [Terrimicrobiaceae bacterium]